MDDEVGWLPGWVERPLEDQIHRVSDIVASDAWVMDTAYGRWLDMVLARTELIVALDYRRWVSFTRLVQRTARRVLTAESVCNSNVETLRKVLSPDSMLVWHFRSFTRKRDRIAAWESDTHSPRVVRLRSTAETERWLATLQSRDIRTRPKQPPSTRRESS